MEGETEEGTGRALMDIESKGRTMSNAAQVARFFSELKSRGYSIVWNGDTNYYEMTNLNDDLEPITSELRYGAGGCVMRGAPRAHQEAVKASLYAVIESTRAPVLMVLDEAQEVIGEGQFVPVDLPCTFPPGFGLTGSGMTHPTLTEEDMATFAKIADRIQQKTTEELQNTISEFVDVVSGRYVDPKAWWLLGTVALIGFGVMILAVFQGVVA
jgi:hypothetical protein